MKIARITSLEGPQWVVDDDGELLLLPEGPFAAQLRPGRRVAHRDEVELAAPASPTKIVCVGRNYAAHAAEHGADVPSEPLLFLKPPSTVIGPHADIELPYLSTQVEHEAEMALIIRDRCRHVRESEAWRHVLGITCANDVTARDLQRSDNQWTRGKGFDTFCPLGPWIITDLEEQAALELRVRCLVNGEPRQDASTNQMVFSPVFLISYITRVMTLEPGDVVLTGTPAGVSPLDPGDEVVVEIEGVGELRNTVIAEARERQG